jgi:hypothetical protein
VFRDYFLDERPGDEVDYAGLAERYGISVTDVSNRLQHCKRRYRELLRGLVLETVSSSGGLEEELRWLFGPVNETERA